MSSTFLRSASVLGSVVALVSGSRMSACAALKPPVSPVVDGCSVVGPPVEVAPVVVAPVVVSLVLVVVLGVLVSRPVVPVLPVVVEPVVFCAVSRPVLVVVDGVLVVAVLPVSVLYHQRKFHPHAEPIRIDQQYSLPRA